MTAYNFPPPSTTFIGRTAEMHDIAVRLADPACRLLTLVGPGGIGKTRLAVEAARHFTFADGIYFVPLQPLTSPDLILSTIAGVLEIVLFASETHLVQMANFLYKKQLLLVMDNFEHLLQGSELLSELLQAATGLKIMTTSREKLNLREEWVIALDGLSFPTTSVTESPEGYSAVQLFVQRARQVQAQFSLDENATAVQTICQQVEGMPLGLELAATWLRVLSCQQIVTQMNQNLDFLTTPFRNIPERHRSLRAVFEQSWRLLSTSEQAVLTKLSVFRGGFDLEAAMQIAGASLSLLAALADKSLIRLNPNGRYDLHELLRQYAADKLLEADLLTTTQQEHFDYFLHLAKEADAHGFGPEQVSWYDRLETELDNLRTALVWSVKALAGMRLAGALGWFFSERYHWVEGYAWLERALAANPDAPVSLRVKVLRNTAALAGHLDNPQQVRVLCHEALELARAADDHLNIAWSLSHLGFSGGYPLDQANTLLDESLALFRKINDPEGLSHAFVRRVFTALEKKDYAYANILAQEAAVYTHEQGDRVAIGWATFVQGKVCWHIHHDFHEAKAYYEASLSLFRQAHFQIGLNTTLISLAAAEQAIGNVSRARTLHEEALRSLRVLGPYHNYLLSVLVGLASVAGAQGQFERAARLLGAVSNKGVPPPIDSGDLHIFENVTATVQAQLGETVFAEAWAAGKAMTSEQAAAYAMESQIALIEIPSEQEQPPLEDLLTRRELEILGLVADGLSNGEIAQHLHFTVSTVKWYLSEIYSKLGVHGRAKAVAHAREQGLLK